jgi:hypothetical protein
VLDDVQRRTLLVEPSRKRPPPLLIRTAHVQLHERAGQLLLLPRRGALARTQPNDRIADAQRLARLHRQIAADAIALVEQADDRHALRHRRAAGVYWPRISLDRHHIGRHFGLRGIRHLLTGDWRLARVIAQPARTLPHADADQRRGGKTAGRDRRLHASGLHAS